MAANPVSIVQKVAQNPQMSQPLQRGQSLASQQRPPPPGIAPQVGPPQQTQRRGSKDQTEVNSISNLNNPFSQQNAVTVGPNQPTVPEPQKNAPPTQSRPPLFRKGSQTTDENKGDEVDDTMRNLRKTFAGIFGDM